MSQPRQVFMQKDNSIGVGEDQGKRMQEDESQNADEQISIRGQTGMKKLIVKLVE